MTLQPSTKLFLFAAGGVALVAAAVAATLLLDRQAPASPDAVVPPQSSTSQPTDGPWSRDIQLRFSENGTDFGEAQTLVERAGVPSVIRIADGRLVAAFQWFPEDSDAAFDRVAVVFSDDEGATWTEPRLVSVDGATWTKPMPPQGAPDGSYQRPFDPTLALTDDGRIRLYFTTVEAGSEDLVIFSAISDDGVTYTLEEGERMNVDDDRNYDSAALLVGDTWHLMTPGPGPEPHAYHVTSDDGLDFTDLTIIGEDDRLNWTGNLVPDGEGMRFYGTSRQGTWWAYSDDGVTWTEPTFLTMDGAAGDPAVVQLTDGRYMMIAVSDKVRSQR